MPRLRQISCQLEWPETGLAFSEYGTVYGDGLVETFIAVPDKPQHFSIHLTSKGYIAEGLAMLVYIDGDYQCNRNRLHLKPPKKGQPRDQTDVDIKLRQKEKTIGGGTFIGRDWRFDCHNIVPNEQFPGGFDPSHFDQLGTIEVMVLRCRARTDDDNGSESLTHSSILDEIDNFGRTPEEVYAPDEAAGARSCGFDGAADDEPHHFGLDGAAPPHGYWTYHSQPPPRNDYGAANHPERRVHFDYGSPTASYYPIRGTSYPHRGQIGGGDRVVPAGHEPSSWHGKRPAEYNGRGSVPAWHGTTQQAPAYPEKGGVGWGWGMPNEAPQHHGEPVPNEYSDYDDPQPYIHPQKPSAPHQPAWRAPGYDPPTNSGWNPAPPASYPVFTPQPQFGPRSGYPGAPAGYQPFYPPPYGVQGPGYTMNYPIPAGGWPETQGGGRSGSLDPAREENNQANDSGNEAQNNAWPNNDGNNNNDSSNTEAAANNTTAGGGDQGGNTGDANDTNNADDTNEPNDGDQNNSGDQQSGNDANASGWNDDNAQDSATQGNGDNNNNSNNNNDNATQNTQPQGNWDNNNNATQNNQTQGNWDNNANNATANQPQQTQNQWNNNDTSAGTGTFQPTSHRSTRPLYGPHGAYYYSCNGPQPHSTANNSGISPKAEAEEEPPFDVPESVAAETGTSHQVQAGKGYLYVHKRASPEYIDGIEEPYARFVFKYRTKEQIEREIGVTIECEPTGDEEKRKFTDKTQDELIELLLRAQSALGGKIPSPPPLPAGDGGEGAKQDGPAPVPVPAPTVYKYLKYELPKGRGPGLGISGGGGGGSNVSQAQPQQQGGGNHWQNLSSSGPAGGLGQPSGQQQQQQQQRQQGGAPNWQTAAENGTQNHNQNQNQSQGQGGVKGNEQNAAGGGASKPSSPGDTGGWGPGPATASNAAGPGISEAPAPAGGTW